MSPMVVEMAQFKAKSGVTDAQLLAASQKAQEGFLSKCTGFLGREILKAKDGSWLDVVHFESLEDAQAAAQQFSEHPSTKAFEQLIDPETAQMRHFEVAVRY